MASAIVLKVALIASPAPLAAEMRGTEISAARRPYSMAAVPGLVCAQIVAISSLMARCLLGRLPTIALSRGTQRAHDA